MNMAGIAIRVIWISRPALRAISSAFRRSTLTVPPPTVPNPSNPTLTGFNAQFLITIAHRRHHTALSLRNIWRIPRIA